MFNTVFTGASHTVIGRVKIVVQPKYRDCNDEYCRFCFIFLNLIDIEPEGLRKENRFIYYNEKNKKHILGIINFCIDALFVFK